MAKHYNPFEPPAPEVWLAMDEFERLHLIENYHSRARIPLPNPPLHAGLHCIVENQLALGDPSLVRKSLERLMQEGIDRHEAIHAIASTLSEHMFELVRGVAPGFDLAAYCSALEKLTVESWRQTYGIEE